MRTLKAVPAALSLAFLSVPAMAGSFVADTIDDPSHKWAGIDYWGVGASQFSTVDQILTFNIVDDSKIDVFMSGAPKFKFTDVLLNGQSIASPFTVDWSTALKATGYAAAGAVSLRFVADYTCADCWGDWFGGYVQVTKAELPKVPIVVPPTTPIVEPVAPVPSAPVSAPVPEPATWAMALAGLALVGLSMRRRETIIHFG